MNEPITSAPNGIGDRILLALRPAMRLLFSFRGAAAVAHLLRRALAFDHTIRVRDFDRSLCFDCQLNEHMGSQIFWRGAYSVDLLPVIDRLLAPGQVVIDVGANAGEITLFCARRVGPLGRVFAFEPAVHNLDRLRRHVAINRADNVQVVPIGAWSHEDRLPLYDAANNQSNRDTNSGLTSLKKTASRAVLKGEIQVVSLDSFLSSEQIDRVHLIKIDVEGAEEEVLLGSEQLISEHRPALIVEIADFDQDDQGSPGARLIALIESMGYRLIEIGRKGRLSSPQWNTKSFANALCLPKERADDMLGEILAK